ncbi:hypothetical protein Tco_0968379 [Tanacetum coccineum]
MNPKAAIYRGLEKRRVKGKHMKCRREKGAGKRNLAAWVVGNFGGKNGYSLQQSALGASTLHTVQSPKQKNFKSAVTEDCWFQAMQDEIHEFDRLDVWGLVPPPDCAMIIALK